MRYLVSGRLSRIESCAGVGGECRPTRKDDAQMLGLHFGERERERRSQIDGQRHCDESCSRRGGEQMSGTTTTGMPTSLRGEKRGICGWAACSGSWVRNQELHMCAAAPGCFFMNHERDDFGGCSCRRVGGLLVDVKCINTSHEPILISRVILKPCSFQPFVMRRLLLRVQVLLIRIRHN